MRIQHWLYLNGRTVFGTMMEEGSTIQDVRQKAFQELESCPGVLCDYPHETPSERRTKIAYAELRVFRSGYDPDKDPVVNRIFGNKTPA